MISVDCQEQGLHNKSTSSPSWICKFPVSPITKADDVDVLKSPDKEFALTNDFTCHYLVIQWRLKSNCLLYIFVHKMHGLWLTICDSSKLLLWPSEWFGDAVILTCIILSVLSWIYVAFNQSWWIRSTLVS